MVQFLSINFFSWISSIFVGFFKSSLFFVSLCSCILLVVIYNYTNDARTHERQGTVIQLLDDQRFCDGARNCTKYSSLIPEVAEAYFAAWESQHNKSK